MIKPIGSLICINFFHGFFYSSTIVLLYISLQTIRLQFVFFKQVIESIVIPCPLQSSRYICCKNYYMNCCQKELGTNTDIKNMDIYVDA